MFGLLWPELSRALVRHGDSSMSMAGHVDAGLGGGGLGVWAHQNDQFRWACLANAFDSSCVMTLHIE
jgi:hypothetical protein